MTVLSNKRFSSFGVVYDRDITGDSTKRYWTLIGEKQYEQESDFEIHMAYVNNTCAAVQNGNPLYWDQNAAQQITGGQIAPPTMMSVWFRPHYWSPGFEEERTGLQLHFDMKNFDGCA